MKPTKPKRCRVCKRRLPEDRVPQDRGQCAWHVPYVPGKLPKRKRPRPLAGGRPR